MRVVEKSLSLARYIQIPTDCTKHITLSMCAVGKLRAQVSFSCTWEVRGFLQIGAAYTDSHLSPRDCPGKHLSRHSDKSVLVHPDPYHLSKCDLLCVPQGSRITVGCACLACQYNRRNIQSCFRTETSVPRYITNFNRAPHLFSRDSEKQFKSISIQEPLFQSRKLHLCIYYK